MDTFCGGGKFLTFGGSGGGEVYYSDYFYADT